MAHTLPEPGSTDSPMTEAELRDKLGVNFEAELHVQDVEHWRHASDIEFADAIIDVTDCAEEIARSTGIHNEKPLPRILIPEIETSGDDRPEFGPGAPEYEPRYFEKVVLLHEALEEAKIPHAFGGAFAADFYRNPRGTRDIDINLFVLPVNYEKVLEVVGSLTGQLDEQQVVDQIEEDYQAVTWWGDVRLDLFFAYGTIHQAAEFSMVEKETRMGNLPVLSAEHVIVFKALWNRPKDWLDIEEIIETQQERLRLPYMTMWMKAAEDPEDRARRLTEVYRKYVPDSD